jgi:hypothetical protein
LQECFSTVICIRSMHLDVMFLKITHHRPNGLGALIKSSHEIGAYLISSRAEVGMVTWWLYGLNLKGASIIMRTVRPPEESASADPRIRYGRRMRINDHRLSNDLRRPLPLPRKIRAVLPYASLENRRCFNKQLGFAARSCTSCCRPR